MTLSKFVPNGGAPADGAVLAIHDLSVTFDTHKGPVRAIEGVDLSVAPGRTLGVVGESGSGKTVTMMGALGLLPGDAGANIEGAAYLEGVDLLSLSKRDRRRYLGRDVGVIFQDPLTSLNPVFTVGFQLKEAMGSERMAAAKRTPGGVDAALETALREVGMAQPDSRLRQYPHELSGGLRQRVMIAMALINRPKILIADEPTTALDVTIQAQILELLKQSADSTGAATVMITHDMGVVAEMADDVAVMYAGRVVETGPAKEVFRTPRHPYTEGLLQSVPALDGAGSALRPIPGDPPQGVVTGGGCAFLPRCTLSGGRDLCRTVDPALFSVGAEGRGAACHFHEELLETRTPVSVVAAAGAPAEDRPPTTSEEPLFVASDLRKDFRLKGAPGLGWFFSRRPMLQAVAGVNLELRAGETLGLVGESGSGKSTVGRLIMGMMRATDGDIEYSVDLRDPNQPGRPLPSEVQIVFQDPYSSLDPRMRVRSIIAEPLRIQRRGRREQQRDRVVELAGLVGLPDFCLDRFPHQLSGGQRQRVGVARALALDPKVLVLDEPVSALDVSVQAQVLNLFEQLQGELDLAYLFISHDLSVVSHVADRVAVMYLGRIVETGTRDEVFERPTHPYTQALLSAIPQRDFGEQSQRIVLEGEMPSASDPPSGCRFRTRCWKATEICAEIDPGLEPRTSRMHLSACHHPAVIEPTEPRERVQGGTND